MTSPTSTPWWREMFYWVLIGFLAVVGFFLVTEHTAHVLGTLPFLLLLVCPLMHLFLHHGHGNHRDRGGQPDETHRH